jgi:hypothetical protein
MLTEEQKATLIESRIQDYNVKIFNLEMDRAAFIAIEDLAQVESVDRRIEALKKAIEAVSGLRG